MNLKRYEPEIGVQLKYHYNEFVESNELSYLVKLESGSTKLKIILMKKLESDGKVGI